MQKKWLITLMCAVSILAAGCGKKDTDDLEALGDEDSVVTTEDMETASVAGEEQETDGNEPIQFDSSNEVYVFQYDASDYVSIEGVDYDALEIPEIEPEEVSDANVESEIESRIKKADKMDITTSGTVKSDDMINVDFHGTVDGKEFDNNSAEDYDMTVGCNLYCGELEENIIGKPIGEEFKVSVTLPSSFGEWEGKVADYTVTVNYVRSYPELTDSLAAELSDQQYQSVEEYKAAVREELEADALAEAQYYAFIQMIAPVADYAEFLQDMPQEETTELTEEEIEIQASLLGMTVESATEYFADGGSVYNEKEDEDWMEYFLLQKIAQDKGIAVYQDEVDVIRDSLLDKGYTEEMIDAMYTEDDLAMYALFENMEEEFLQLE